MLHMQGFYRTRSIPQGKNIKFKKRMTVADYKKQLDVVTEVLTERDTHMYVHVTFYIFLYVKFRKNNKMYN